MRPAGVEREVRDGAVADVAVVGAGPAGIAAAARAAECGLRVVVLHHAERAGGQIWRHVREGALSRLARRWLARLAASGAHVVGGTSVVDVRRAAGGEFDLLCERGGAELSVHARTVLLATGARELFLPFPGWTLPGVLGVGGAQALVKSGATFRGRRVIVAGSGPLLLPVAAVLARGGARLGIVAEQADRKAVRRFAAGLWRTPMLLAQAVAYRAAFATTAYRTGTWVTAAHGERRVEGVTLTDGRRSWESPADVVCTGFGLVPNTEIARLLGCETRGGEVKTDDEQATSVAGVYAAGEVTGVGGAQLALVEGEIAGLVIAGRRAAASLLFGERTACRESARRMRAAFELRSELRALPASDTVVCRCEDVLFGTLCASTSARQSKLSTRAGMGACQGRVCGDALRYLRGWESDTVRPPIEPTLVSVLASDAGLPPTLSSLRPTCPGDLN